MLGGWAELGVLRELHSYVWWMGSGLEWTPRSLACTLRMVGATEGLEHRKEVI